MLRLPSACSQTLDHRILKESGGPQTHAPLLGVADTTSWRGSDFRLDVGLERALDFRRTALHPLSLPSRAQILIADASRALPGHLAQPPVGKSTMSA
jgi:hypothetical protein